MWARIGQWGAQAIGFIGGKLFGTTGVGMISSAATQAAVKNTFPGAVSAATHAVASTGGKIAATAIGTGLAVQGAKEIFAEKPPTLGQQLSEGFNGIVGEGGSNLSGLGGVIMAVLGAILAPLVFGGGALAAVAGAVGLGLVGAMAGKPAIATMEKMAGGGQQAAPTGSQKAATTPSTEPAGRKTTSMNAPMEIEVPNVPKMAATGPRQNAGASV